MQTQQVPALLRCAVPGAPDLPAVVSYEQARETVETWGSLNDRLENTSEVLAPLLLLASASRACVCQLEQWLASPDALYWKGTLAARLSHADLPGWEQAVSEFSFSYERIRSLPSAPTGESARLKRDLRVKYKAARRVFDAWKAEAAS